MAQWEKMCPVEEVPDGSKKKLPLGALDILIVHQGKKFYACAAECPHLGESLETGEVHGHVIRCNGHGYKLDIANGKCLTEGALELPIFPVDVKDGWIWIKA